MSRGRRPECHTPVSDRTVSVVELLPDVVLEDIISLLTLNDLVRSVWGVCRRWRWVAKGPALWRHVSLLSRPCRSYAAIPRLLKSLRDPSSVEEITLDVTDNVPSFRRSQLLSSSWILSLIATCPNVARCHVTDFFKEHLPAILSGWNRTLNRLTFHSTGGPLSSDVESALLRHGAKLHGLHVSNVPMSVQSITALLQAAPSLNILSLALPRTATLSLTDGTVAASNMIAATLARSCPGLAQLTIVGPCPCFSLIGCRELLTLTKLERVALLDIPVQSDVLNQLCSYVQEVSCNSGDMETVSITDSPALQSLECDSSPLHTVRLQNCPKLLRASLGSLCRYDLVVDSCPALKELVVEDVVKQLSLHGVESLEQLTLEELPDNLDVAVTTWTLPHLRTLYLGPRVDNGVPLVVSSLSFLRSQAFLCLHRLHITHADLCPFISDPPLVLSDLPALAQLVLSSCQAGQDPYGASFPFSVPRARSITSTSTDHALTPALHVSRCPQLRSIQASFVLSLDLHVFECPHLEEVSLSCLGRNFNTEETDETSSIFSNPDDENPPHPSSTQRPLSTPSIPLAPSGRDHRDPGSIFSNGTPLAADHAGTCLFNHTGSHISLPSSVRHLSASMCNLLQSLDLSRARDLRSVHVESSCAFAPDALDLSTCPALSSLSLRRLPRLTSLSLNLPETCSRVDVGENPSLRSVALRGLGLVSLDAEGSPLEELDRAHCPYLKVAHPGSYVEECFDDLGRSYWPSRTNGRPFT